VEAANAAETDSVLINFLKERVGLATEEAFPIFKDFREIRERATKARDGQNRTPM
jgi:hypothetical protein